MYCPNCNKKITWQQIAFATFPFWITCNQCGVSLEGNLFIKVQAILVVLLSVCFGLIVFLIEGTLLFRIIIFWIGILLIVIPNVWLTLKNGEYHVNQNH